MQTPRLIVSGYSFARRRVEPGPCNIKLAKAVAALVRSYGRDNLLVVVQWEIARALERFHGIHADHVVELRDGEYLNSDHVLEATLQCARDHKLDERTPILVVAQPVIHLQMLWLKVRMSRWRQKFIWPGWIGFDNEKDDDGQYLNLQWWTRSMRALMLYTPGAALRNKRGDDSHRDIA